jgi:hypothetical protein
MNKQKLLKGIFKSIENNIIYCIVRWDKDKSPFDIEGDIDIFCNDIEIFTSKILQVANKYVEKNLIYVNVTTVVEAEQYHMDFFDLSNNMLFRLDIYQKPPQYKKFIMSDKYFYYTLASRVARKIEEISLYFTSPIDEYMVRLLEYFDKIEERPEKIKHLEFINAHATPEDFVELEVLIEKFIKGKLIEHPNEAYFTKRNILANE